MHHILPCFDRSVLNAAFKDNASGNRRIPMRTSWSRRSVTFGLIAGWAEIATSYCRSIVAGTPPTVAASIVGAVNLWAIDEPLDEATGPHPQMSESRSEVPVADGVWPRNIHSATPLCTGSSAGPDARNHHWKQRNEMKKRGGEGWGRRGRKRAEPRPIKVPCATGGVFIHWPIERNRWLLVRVVLRSLCRWLSFLGTRTVRPVRQGWWTTPLLKPKGKHG